jgi:hypothetical protein
VGLFSGLVEAVGARKLGAQPDLVPHLIIRVAEHHAPSGRRLFITCLFANDRLERAEGLFQQQIATFAFRRGSAAGEPPGGPEKGARTFSAAARGTRRAAAAAAALESQRRDGLRALEALKRLTR